MKLDVVIQQLKLQDLHEAWRKDWTCSQEVFNSGSIEFLSDNFIDGVNAILQLPEDATREIHRAAAIIRENESLSRLVWHCHYLLFLSGKDQKKDILSNWPSFRASMGDLEGMSRVIIFISGLPRVMKIYCERGIPQEIAVDTFSDLEIWMRHYLKGKNVWGLSNLWWLMHHVSGEIFKIGRLQYQPSSFSEKIRVFRNSTRESTVALAEDGVHFRGDGLIDGTNGIFDHAGGWVSHLEVKEEYIRGNPILPEGYAVKEETVLSAEEWELVLTDSDPVLYVHIPEGSKMSYELCIESLKKAIEFFGRYFPEKPFYAFVCNTWFFDPQYRELLPASSNIVRLQKEFYLFPILSDDSFGLERIFGKADVDQSNAPRDTQLRRAVLDHMAAGNHIRASGGFIMKDDVKAMSL